MPNPFTSFLYKQGVIEPFKIENKTEYISRQLDQNYQAELKFEIFVFSVFCFLGVIFGWLVLSLVKYFYSKHSYFDDYDSNRIREVNLGESAENKTEISSRRKTDGLMAKGQDQGMACQNQTMTFKNMKPISEAAKVSATKNQPETAGQSKSVSGCKNPATFSSDQFQNTIIAKTSLTKWKSKTQEQIKNEMIMREEAEKKQAGKHNDQDHLAGGSESENNNDGSDTSNGDGYVDNNEELGENNLENGDHDNEEIEVGEVDDDGDAGNDENDECDGVICETAGEMKSEEDDNEGEGLEDNDSILNDVLENCSVGCDNYVDDEIVECGDMDCLDPCYLDDY